jgi:hypothetical protein
VTLPEKIKQLKAAIDAVNEPCEVCGNTADEYGRIEHGRGCYVVEEDGGGYSHVPLEDLGTAARETCPPLIAAYTAILTALESSDSDRQKLAARVKALEDLVGHCWVHSGYRDCGYDQMDSEMREMYDAVKCLSEPD